MNEQILRDHYEKRGFSAANADGAVDAVHALEAWLSVREKTLETAQTDDIRTFIRMLIDEKRNSADTLLALARYFYLTGRNAVYVYFTSLLGGEGVVESIRCRLADLEGGKSAEALVGTLPRPPLGSDPVEYPAFTRSLMERLETNLPKETVCRVLAGNHHQIPASAFEAEKEYYRKAGSMDEYLADHHKRQVAELQRYCDTNTVWYEQVITQEVVDFVAANPEIQSAVRDGDTLYATKIPYDPARYLAETDPVLKRYYACHCPFVREAIRRGETDVSENWCYCSGGFTKYPYDVILGRDLRVDLLQSALKGDPVCRFAIHLDGAAEK
jgi:hypothetical protein